MKSDFGQINEKHTFSIFSHARKHASVSSCSAPNGRKEVTSLMTLSLMPCLKVLPTSSIAASNCLQMLANAIANESSNAKEIKRTVR